MKRLLDPEMIAGYTEMKDNFRGLTVIKQTLPIRTLVKKHQCLTVLDYGAGKGEAYEPEHVLHKKIGIKRQNVTLYEPSVPALAVRPEGRKFDGVICSDVMEHIPEQDVDAVIEDLFQFADKFVFASICCREAKKTFRNLRGAGGALVNLHVTVKPFEWWQQRFEALRPASVEVFLIQTP